jgi:hypothetical protein
VTDRKTANVVAAIVFVIALLIGAWLFGRNGALERPTTTTVVTKSALPAHTTSQESKRAAATGSGRKKTTQTTTTRTKATTPAAPASTETTSVTGSRSFVERLLGEKGVIFLQIGVVLLAAFIAAAAAQRVLVGQFGFKLGVLEVPELADASEKTIKELTLVAQSQQALNKQLTALSVEIRKVQEELRRTEGRGDRLDSVLNERLGVIARQLAALESQRGA